MDRRTFLKVMSAVFAAIPFNTSGSQQAATPERRQAGEFLPRMRLIALGLGSLELQAWNAVVAGWPKEDMLYIDSKGHIKHDMFDELDTFAKDAGWQKCHASLPFLDLKKLQFKAIEHEVADFIQAADWLIMVVTLDNAIAFAVCDEIARIAKNADVLTMAYVGAPYCAYGHPNADVVSNNDLIKCSKGAIDRMLGACDLVLPDEGGWSNGQWELNGQDSVFSLILDAGMNREHAGQFTAMLRAAGMGYYGWGCSGCAREAIQEGLDPYMYDSYCGKGELVTSNGAIVRVSGHPDVVENLKRDVELALLQHQKILRGNWPFWHDKSKFMVITEPDASYSPISRDYVLDILSIGLERVRTCNAATDALERWRNS